ERRFFGNTPAVRRLFLHKQLCLANLRQRISMNATTDSPFAGKDVGRLRNPDFAEIPWPQLASARRIFLPLLGERAGVRADVSARITSKNRTKLFVGSGVLRLKLLAVVGGLCALNFSPPDSRAAGQGMSSEPS